MPIDYIADSDPSQQSNPNTFSSIEAARAAIVATHGSDLMTPNAMGLVRLLVRNSSGVPFVDSLRFTGIHPDNVNASFDIVGQKRNGFPAIVEDDLNAANVRTMSIKGVGNGFYGEEEDSFIIRGGAATATRYVIGFDDTPSKFEYVNIDGGATEFYGGIGGGVVAGKNVKIQNCHLVHVGAVRNGLADLDYCTINNCRMIRDIGTVTNSQIMNITDLGYCDGFKAGTDHNAFDGPASLVKYAAGASASTENLNSLFDVDKAANLVDDGYGGFDVTVNSILINADSSGTGVIGASSSALSSAPPESGDANITVLHNATKAINLLSHVTDDNNQVNWDSLIISQNPVHGTISVTGSLVTVDYTGTNYVGDDSFQYRVSDLDGNTSDAGVISIVVFPLPSTATLVEAGIVRGQTFTMTLGEHTAGKNVGYVEVYLKDAAGDGTEYPCEVLVYTDTELTCMAPLAMPAFSGGQILIKPITSFG